MYNYIVALHTQVKPFFILPLDTNRRKELLAMAGGESEIARLMAQIDAETTAAYHGLYGLAWGTSRHDIINAKMERIAALNDELTAQLGEEAAISIILQVLEQVGS